MATRRRSTSPASKRRTRRSGFNWPSPEWSLSPTVARSLVGIVFLVLGAVTLIALALPGEGKLTDLWRDNVVPWFGTGRWLLPFLLLGAGLYLEGGRGTAGWQVTLAGLAVSYAGFLGLLEWFDGTRPSGGHIGYILTTILTTLITRPGAFIVLLALAIGGLLVMLEMSLPTLLGPLGRTMRDAAGVLARPAEDRPSKPGSDPGASRRQGRNGGRGSSTSEASSPGQAGIWGAEGSNGRPGIPAAVPSSTPVSSTFAPAVSANGGIIGSVVAPSAVAERPPVPAERDREDVTNVADSAPQTEEPPYALPPLTLLDDIAPRTGGATMDHERNAAIISGKLASFNIPARVVKWNAGPVVTQYEVEPDPSVKVSRIEALADDLSMALAARTIRIEAPIPGRSVVGIEIPNSDFNIVALRRILEEVDFKSSGSRLTFALGRDVAGHARAADLAKMPHLLIAGATGSGKSVMVNALITSLLCEATPNEVRMILVDMKRVELASYNALPHLMVPVITEPEKAKAALKWAVTEMDSRYRRFAGATARNIAGYNETRVDPVDRLPYLIIIIDELADLMMREGKNIEEPIVRLAQKARATGIHLVLATQRPSVNVVTGLIKANFPSRIAFAMASQIDSRTILDAPGAEDLIGRGDMLFQPADMPRPVRLQGVFVADKEISRVTEYWRSWEQHYDLGIVESDEDGTGAVDDLADEDADRLLHDAVDVIREYDRASASLLQRRLKIGYARAARIIDQLEARGYIGAFDGSNARQVLRRDAGPGTSVAGDGYGGDDIDE